MIRLDTLTESDLPLIVEWRKADPAGARTPYDISIEQERAWFSRLQEPGCRDRYWALRRYDDVHQQAWRVQSGLPAGEHIGLTGLTSIEWENGRAEIALLVDPTLRGKGYGSEGVRLTLEQAFDRMRLASVYGEVYHCNKYLEFWCHQVGKYRAFMVTLTKAKWWNGQHWPAMHFTIIADGWRAWKAKQ